MVGGGWLHGGIDHARERHAVGQVGVIDGEALTVVVEGAGGIGILPGFIEADTVEEPVRRRVAESALVRSEERRVGKECRL